MPTFHLLYLPLLRVVKVSALDLLVLGRDREEVDAYTNIVYILEDDSPVMLRKVLFGVHETTPPIML